MDIEYYKEEYRKERRARLAAERLLEQKQSQLKSANHKLSQHAINLSGQIVDQRKVLDKLQGENNQAAAQSLKANHKALAAERMLWDAVTSIQDGFALFDKDRKLISANRPYLDLFRSAQNVGPGISMESILELCLEGSLIELDGKTEDEWYEFMLERLEKDDIQPITLRLHNGVFVKLVDRRTSDGGIVSLALNITDTIEREEELLLARDNAQAADRAKSSFLAKMSHEFRTPINGVVGIADLMLERATDEESLLYANTIKASGESLLGFVDNVLEYAMIDANRLELRSDVFEFADVLKDVKNSVPAQEISEHTTVTFDTDPSVSAQLIGDAKRIGQVVKNLYSNALKNTDQGTVMVRTTWNQTDTGTGLTIAVEDSGSGIPEAKVGHIFGGFNQMDDSYARNQDGAGLGLSIVQKLVDAMNGTLDIESIEGEGSHFVVTIPIGSKNPVVASDAPPAYSDPAILVSQSILTRAAMARALHLCKVDFQEMDHLPLALNPDVAIAFVDAKLLRETREKMPDKRVIPFGTETGCLSPPYLSSDIDQMLKTRPSIGISNSNPGTLRVLAAEDNKTNQLVFQKMLKDLDINLKMVSNGLEAVDAFKTFDPHLIFMDISMPKMDGMEATQQIRWHEAENGLDSVFIVAMTAHALEGDEARIRNCGLDDYMTKPLSKASILERIERTGLEIGISKPDQKVS